jgi:hypothetical protein
MKIATQHNNNYNNINRNTCTQTYRQKSIAQESKFILYNTAQRD